MEMFREHILLFLFYRSLILEPSSLEEIYSKVYPWFMNSMINLHIIYGMNYSFYIISYLL